VTTPDLSLVRQMDNAQEGYRPVAGGVLSVDVERARAVVGELRAVADDLALLRRDLIPDAVTAPAADAVSQNAAAQAVKMLRASRSYLVSWHQDLMAAVVALERQIADYEQADYEQTARL